MIFLCNVFRPQFCRRLFTFSLKRIIMPKQNLKKEYWQKNLQYLAVLLGIWFTVSYGFSILLVDLLDKIKIFGFKLGFWFSQQGSIFVFVILIFVYVRLMNKLDKKYKCRRTKELKNRVIIWISRPGQVGVPQAFTDSSFLNASFILRYA